MKKGNIGKIGAGLFLAGTTASNLLGTNVTQAMKPWQKAKNFIGNTSRSLISSFAGTKMTLHCNDMGLVSPVNENEKAKFEKMLKTKVCVPIDREAMLNGTAENDLGDLENNKSVEVEWISYNDMIEKLDTKKKENGKDAAANYVIALIGFNKRVNAKFPRHIEFLLKNIADPVSIITYTYGCESEEQVHEESIKMLEMTMENSSLSKESISIINNVIDARNAYGQYFKQLFHGYSQYPTFGQAAIILETILTNNKEKNEPLNETLIEALLEYISTTSPDRLRLSAEKKEELVKKLSAVNGNLLAQADIASRFVES